MATGLRHLLNCYSATRGTYSSWGAIVGAKANSTWSGDLGLVFEYSRVTWLIAHDNQVTHLK